MPLATVLRVQMGYQEGFESNLWQACANIGAMVGVVGAALSEASLPWLILAANGIPVFVTFLNWSYQFIGRRRWLMPSVAYFDIKTGGGILRAGVIFAALQLVAFIGVFSDNFVIAQTLGPGAVAPYAILYKVYSAIFVVQFIISPLWPALNEAISRGELIQARQMFVRAMVYCLGGGGFIAVLLIAVGRPVIALWVGQDFVPEWSLLVGFGAWALVASYYAAIAALLSSGDFLLQQLRIFGLAAIFSLTLKVILVNLLGISGAIWATVIGYGVLILYARAVSLRALGYV
jgi:O-antigen/teichoic acid export membrane protein